MKLDIRNKAQARICKDAVVTLNGKRRHDCIVADSDNGYIEVSMGTRSVGIAKLPILRRIEGEVLISINGRLV